MLINDLLSRIQNKLSFLYDNSIFLKNIDWLIGLGIIILIISTTFTQSDILGNIAILIILLTVIKFLTTPNKKFTITNSEKFLLIYLIFVVISLFGSSLFNLSLKGFSKTLIYLGFYVSVVEYLLQYKNRTKYIFITIAAITSFESVVAFLQNFSCVEEISGWQDISRLNPEEIMTRVYGTLKPYNPNLFGGFLLACLPSFLALPAINTTSKKKVCLFLYIASIGLIFGSIALVLTGCRGAYIGFFVEFLALIVFAYNYLKKNYKKLFSSLIGIFVALSSFFILSNTALRARIFSIFAMRSDSSNSFRFNVYNSCIQMFKDNWLLGIGCGNQNFREIYGLYMKTGFDALSAYNIYLEIAVESGIFALLMFILYVLTTLKNATASVLKRMTFDNLYVIAAIISIFGILIHGFVDTVFFRPQIQFIFWIMMAIIRVFTYEDNKKRRGYNG